jgi:PAS domain-containing protein
MTEVKPRRTLGHMSHPTVEENRWRLALERASFGVWDLDPRLEIVHYSPAWKARLGFPRIHAPDSTAFWRCRVHPDDLDPMLDSLRAHLDGCAPSYEMRFRLRSNGSGYRTMLSRGRIVARDARGQATRMVGTMVDLTGRPAAAAPHGLAAEDPWRAPESSRLPFHAALGAAHPPVELIDDLLERAVREAGLSL